MRRINILFVGALVVATPLAAQNHDKAWSVTVTASLTGFRGVSADTSTPADLTIRPSQGIAVGIAAARHWGPWALSLGISHLPTHVQAVSSELAVQERTTELDRVRLVATVARHLVRVGAGGLEIRAGPTFDDWSVAGQDGRIVSGGEAALELRLPAGPLGVEHILGFGWSAGPFRAAELPAGYRRRGIRAVSVGLGLRFGI